MGFAFLFRRRVQVGTAGHPWTPLQVASFWIVTIATYLILSTFAMSRGIGYTERVDGDVVVFDYQSFLWLPHAFLPGYPPENPIPYLVWWVLLSFVIAAFPVLLIHRVQA